MKKLIAGLVSLCVLSSFAIAKDQKEIEKEIKQIAGKYGCLACHDIDKPKNSIPYRVIAKEYQGQPDAVEKLFKSVKFASFGKWQKIGPKKYGMKPRAIYMPRQRSIPPDELRKLLKLILSLDTSSVKVKSN